MTVDPSVRPPEPPPDMSGYKMEKIDGFDPPEWVVWATSIGVPILVIIMAALLA